MGLTTENNMSNTIIQKIIKGIGIASAGGGIAIGAGTMDLVDVDFITIVMVVIFSSGFNAIYQFLKNKIDKKK